MVHRRNIALTAFILAALIAAAFVFFPGLMRSDSLGIFYFPAILLAVIFAGASHSPGTIASSTAFAVYTVMYWVIILVVYAILCEAYILRRALKKLDFDEDASAPESDPQQLLLKIADVVRTVDAQHKRHFLLQSNAALPLDRDSPELAAAHILSSYGRDRTVTRVVDRIRSRFPKSFAGVDIVGHAHQEMLEAAKQTARMGREHKLPLGALPPSNSADTMVEVERALLFGDEAQPLAQVQGAALAFSGGGIRSASFGLGVLQAILRTGKFECFDYLSTVSGGGYLGAAISWLRQRAPDLESFSQHFRGTSDAPGSAGKRSPYVWLDYVRHHSKYLTPGKISDLSLVGTVLRGVLFNVLVYGSVVTALITWLINEEVLPAPAKTLAPRPWYGVEYWALLGGLLFGGSIVLYAIGTWIASRSNRTAVICAVATLAAMGGTCWLLINLGWLDANPTEGPWRWTVVAALPLLIAYVIPDVYGLLRESVHRKQLLPSHRWQYIGRVRFQTRLGAFVGGLSGVLVLWSLPHAYGAVGAGFAALASATVSTVAGLIGSIYQFLMGRSKQATDSLSGGTRIIISAALLIYGLMLLSYQLAFALSASPLWMAGVAILIGGGGIVGTLVNTNYFGLGRMYRDRLMEAFMPNKDAVARCQWQQADEADEAQLIQFRRGSDGTLQRPLHLINCNVVMVDASSDRFRGRGGDSFLLSPWYCGSNATGWVPADRLGDGSLTLATAVAISGAAVNPDGGADGRGVTRNRLVSFLLSLLNIRLGYWLPNPARPRDLMQSFAPNLWVPGIVQGLFGRGLNEQAIYVETTDGGHFDNTALYELLRRRVKTIVVSEAGQDEKYQMEDLANVMERARADFGVEIQFDVTEWNLTHLRPDESGLARRGFSIGRIIYPGVAGHGASEGALLYLQLAPIKNMGPDTDSYRRRFPDFPNQTTADQFFDEEQFEAYRELGLKTALEAMETLDAAVAKAPSGALAALRAALLNPGKKDVPAAGR